MTQYGNGFLLRKAFLCGLIMLLFSISGWAQELLEMPTPTHFVAKVPHSKLVLVKEVLPSFDKNLFMAAPYTIAAGKNGKFYVYDNRLIKIFIFNNQGECVGKILEWGKKPGQLRTDDGFTVDMNIGPDDSIYVHEGKTNKLLQFSPDGQFIKERILSRENPYKNPFKLVVDKSGNFYSYGLGQGIIDQLDENMNLLHTFLDRNLNDCYIIYKPNYDLFLSKSYYKEFYESKEWLRAKMGNTSFDITTNGLLFVYLHNPSTVYLFNGKQLVQQFDVRIDDVLSQFKDRVEKDIIHQKKVASKAIRVTEMVMFGSCFVDQDEPYFYLQFFPSQNHSILYQIDLKGKLIRILTYGKGRIFFKAKRNGLFFGLASENKHPIIMNREE